MTEYFPLILLFFALLILITRPFTVLFHELGHAIPVIILTRQGATIYIGSYGDQNKSLHFRIRLLDVWIKYNPFKWGYGLCIPSAKHISINKQIIYVLIGPIASFLIATAACYFTFIFDLHGFVKLILVLFLGSSIFDLFVNLTPRKTPIILYDGNLTYNDGYLLLKLFYYKRFPKEYGVAAELYNQKKYAEASTYFHTMIKNGLRDENIFRLTISSFLQIRNYDQAKELIDEFMSKYTMSSDDFANAAIVYSHLNLSDKAIEFCDKSLELNSENKYSLNNKGYILNTLNKFEEAIVLIDKAIAIDKSFAYSYNNRGLAKIKIGKTEEGLKDINHSLKLDENNSYAYRNLGIYHLEKGEYEKALELLEKAKKLDSTTHLIEKLIANAKNKENKGHLTT